MTGDAGIITDRRREFVIFVVALMAVNALGVDLMLPAFSAIGRDLHVDAAWDLQRIITAYVLGFGVGQLAYGPIADRLGRKPVLHATLLAFAAACVLGSAAQTFPALLLARFVQGLASASTRVLSIAMVRDSYSGRSMARVMSMAQAVFFVIPILAPSLGQFLLHITDWRGLFMMLSGFSLVIAVWSLARFPETLPPERRRAISIGLLTTAYREVLLGRRSVLYTCCNALTFGAIITFVSLSQQVFTDVFQAGGRFVLLFAICAFAMSCASFLNSRLVTSFGPRRIACAAVLALVALSSARCLIVFAGWESLWTFVALQALSMACVGLCGSNFGAMAMEPVGHIAGTASSLQGSLATIGGVVIAAAIGMHHGSSSSFAVGYLLIGVSLLVIMSVAERAGRLSDKVNGA